MPMSSRPIFALPTCLRRMTLLSIVAMASLMPVGVVAQQQLPTTISPIRVESDPNGVNLVNGKSRLNLPILAVPGAPNLRLDRIQNLAPYMSARTSGELQSLLNDIVRGERPRAGVPNVIRDPG
jgi:hypothetical protein